MIPSSRRVETRSGAARLPTGATYARHRLERHFRSSPHFLSTSELGDRIREKKGYSEGGMEAIVL